MGVGSRYGVGGLTSSSQVFCMPVITGTKRSVKTGCLCRGIIWLAASVAAEAAV